MPVPPEARGEDGAEEWLCTDERGCDQRWGDQQRAQLPDGPRGELLADLLSALLDATTPARLALPAPLTAAQFEERYAAEAGVTVEFLHWWGRYAERCDCGDPGCEGWSMGHQWEDAIVINELRGGGR
jgi:hypothetical protein